MPYNILRQRGLKMPARRPDFIGTLAGGLVKSRSALFVLRLIFVILYLIIIYAGLFGSVYRNIGSIATGIIWLTLISLVVPVFGKVWCTVCPWNTIVDWFQFALGGFRRTRYYRTPFSLARDLPRWLQGLGLPVLLLSIMVFIEYDLGITHNPRMTAYLALTILVAALIFGLLFKRRSFCRYTCPVGIMSGLWARFAPLELRSINRNTCEHCSGKDCLNGNERGLGCPVFEFPSTMSTNAYCTLCLECLKTCPYDNLTINLRPPAQDLKSHIPHPTSEIFLIILLLVFTTFHGFYTSPLGGQFNQMVLPYVRFGQAGLSALLVIIALIISALIILLTIRFPLLATLVLTLIPLLIFTHLGLVLKQFSFNIPEILYTIGDPLGENWNILGNRSFGPYNLQSFIKYLQVSLLAFGFFFSIYLMRSKVTKSYFLSIGYYVVTMAYCLLILCRQA